MMPKVKICGIRSLEAAQTAVICGADFLGFNFIANSKRYISPQKAKEIIGRFPQHVKMVGVFKDEPLKTIIEITELLKLDFIQLHGEKKLDFTELTQHAGVIKAYSLPSSFEAFQVIDDIQKSDIDFALLETSSQQEEEILNPMSVREVSSHHQIFLSGGLTVENVGYATRMAQPYAVDVSSGVETGGEQDVGKIKLFIRNAKSVT